MKAWKEEEKLVSTAVQQKSPRSDEHAAINALWQQYKVYVYIKRSGPRFDYYRNNLHNTYNENIVEYTSLLIAAHSIMDHHKIIQSQSMKAGDNTKEVEKGGGVNLHFQKGKSTHP